MIEHSNLEAENAILSVILHHNEALIKVSDILKADNFSDSNNQKIYEEILKKINLEKEEVDFTTMRPFFQLLPSGLDHLSHLRSINNLMNPVRTYAFSVAELSNKRDLILGFNNLLAASDEDSSSDLVAKTQDLIASTRFESKEVEIIDGDCLIESLQDSWKEGSASVIIPSGLPSLDKMLNGGFAIDRLYTIGAAPGTGKTSLAQQVIVNALEKDYGALFFSMEMERKNLLTRFLASFAQINPFRILINNIFQQEKERFDDALTKWQSLSSNYFMTEKGHLTLPEMENVLKRKLRTSPIKLVVVDYIQIMALRDARNINEASLIKENINGLQDLATKYHVSVIVLSQLAKSAIGEKPGLKALKGSGGIAEDSDCVINLWNDSEDEQQGSVKSVNVEVAKNRNGPKGDIVINFDGEFNKFTEINF